MAEDLRWYEVVALHQDGATRVLGENEPRATIQGEVEGNTVVRVNLRGYSPGQVQQALKAVQIMLEEAGIKKALIVPEGVEFLGLRQAAPEKSAELEDNLAREDGVTH